MEKYSDVIEINVNTVAENVPNQTINNENSKEGKHLSLSIVHQKHDSKLVMKWNFLAKPCHRQGIHI